jgi:hypothetical protein
MGYVLSRLDVNFLWIRLGWVRELGWVGSGGSGWVGSKKIFSAGRVGLGHRAGGLGWVGSECWWAGLGWVSKNGPTDNSASPG